MTSKLPGIDNSQVKPSRPQMVKEPGCGPFVLFIIILICLIL